jgi:hypothetical protein
MVAPLSSWFAASNSINVFFVYFLFRKIIHVVFCLISWTGAWGQKHETQRVSVRVCGRIFIASVDEMRQTETKQREKRERKDKGNKTTEGLPEDRNTRPKGWVCAFVEGWENILPRTAASGKVLPVWNLCDRYEAFEKGARGSSSTLLTIIFTPPHKFYNGHNLHKRH